MDGYIHSIESFGTVDGPGIRFVVFLQGCPMRCLYCHNPDTWNLKDGKLTDTDDLISKFNAVKNFTRGGVTVTGGEPLMQIEFVTEFFEKLKKDGIHTCIDTSGITFNPENKDYMNKLDKLLGLTDLVMLDIKHIDDEEHMKLTSHSNKKILEFAKYLSDKGIEIWIRHVVVPTITFNEKYLYELGRFMAQLKTVKALDVLPYHDMGKAKYKELGLEYKLKDIKPLEKEKAEQAKKIILKGYKDAKIEMRNS